MGKKSKSTKAASIVQNAKASASSTTRKNRLNVFIRRPHVSMLLIVVVGFLVYSNTFSVPFAFDDETAIYRNATIRDMGNFAKDPVSGILFNSRIVGQLSFALNHAVHGLDVRGYHIVNLLIHLLSALLVYRLVVLTFRTPYLSGYFQKTREGFIDIPRFVALFTALLFVSHPIQTQAVTYIVQRYASLATLFYLLSIVMYVQSRLSALPRGRYAFYALSVISAILAMKTKEIAFTLPVMVVLYELMFFRGEMRKRMLYLVPLILTMLIIPLSMMGGRGALTGAASIDKAMEGASLNVITWSEYLNTQFRVIVTYIRLLFLPIHQNLDYDYPIYKTFFDPPVILSFSFLISIFSWGVYLVYRSFRTDNDGRYWLRLMGFGIFWFFITLSVESSVVPIADVIFEHRLYLPSVGFFLAVMAGVMWIGDRYVEKKPLIRRGVLPLMIIVVISLSVTAYARNLVWQSEVTLWEDVVKKSPGKPRPNYNLGLFYSRQNRLDEAIAHYQAAIRIAPDYYRPYNDLGNAYFNKGRFDEALHEYKTAIALKPDYAKPYNNIGIVYAKSGRYADAAQNFHKALELDPTYVDARRNLDLLNKQLSERR